MDDLQSSGAVLELLHNMEASVPSSHPSSSSLCQSLSKAWATLPIPSTPPALPERQTDGSSEAGEVKKCKSSEFWAQIALDYSWEHLHSGYWQDVKLFWRKAYSLAALLKTFNLVLQGKDQEALVETDKGILMGAPIINHSLHHIATLLRKRLVQTEGDEVIDPASIEDNQLTRRIGKVKFRNYTPSLSSTDKKRKIFDSAGTKTEYIGCTSCDIKDIPLVDMERRLPTVHCPSLEEFYKHHMTCSVPLVISGAMDHWPAYAQKKWK